MRGSSEVAAAENEVCVGGRAVHRRRLPVTLPPGALALSTWARTLGLTNDGGREPGQVMAATSGDGGGILREIAEIAVCAVTVAERPETILVALQPVIPFEGGRVLLADPATGGPMPLMSQGCDARTREYVGDPNNVRGADVAGVSRTRKPMCLRDLPVGSLDNSDWRECLHQPVPRRHRRGVVRRPRSRSRNERRPHRESRAPE